MRILLATILTVAFAGCGVELLTTTAVTGELQAEQMSRMKNQIEHAAGETGKVNLQRAVDLYQAEKGAYPQSLDEVAPAYIASVPMQPNGAPYAYNPATGKVSETDGTMPARPMPAGPTQEDIQNLRTMGAAIQQYAMRNNRYPASLQALVPQYLNQVPRTSSGQAFVYNAQRGLVAHPSAELSPGGNPQPAPYDPSRGFGNARTQHQMETMDKLGL